MAWKRDLTDLLLGVLRFAIRGVLLVNGIALAILSVYIVVKVCWNFAHFLDRTIFSAPW